MKRTIALMSVAVLASSCLFAVNEVNGDGDIVTEERDHDGYTQVSLSGVGNMVLAEGDSFSLTIRTDANLMEYIETSVRGDTLVVELRSGHNVDPSDGIDYTVTLPELTGLEVSGVGQIDIGTLEAGDLSVSVSGVGGVTIGDLDAESVTVDLSGVGSIEIDGETATLDVSASGTGSFDGGDLRADDGVVESSGVGSVTVWVTDTLDISASGVGSVRYHGSPSLTADASGLGGLESLGDK